MRRHVGLALALALGMLIASCLAAYVSVRHYADANQQLNYSYTVIRRAERALLQVIEVETAQRLYVLTGEGRPFDQYRAARNGLDEDLHRLRRLAEQAGRPQQSVDQRSIDGLEPLIAQRLAWAEHIIRLRRERGRDAAADEMASGEGMVLTDAIRAQLQAMLDAQQQALMEASTRARRAASNSAKAVASGCVIAFSLLLLSTWALMTRERALRLANEALHESEAQARLLLESTGEGIFAIDLDARCTLANASALRILGYREMTEVIGRNMHQLIHHSRADGSPCPIEECSIVQAMRANVGTHHDDEVFWRADGTSFAVEYRSYPIRRAGQSLGAVITFSDITERRQMERLKDELISTVSHELRTPLTSVVGSLGLLNGGVLGDLAPEVKAMVDIAYRNSDRLARLINDILNMDKIESGKMQFDVRPINLNALLQEALDTSRPYAAQFGIKLVLEETDPAIRVCADSDRLIQVLTNLLSNAIKFSPRGEAVRVRVQRIDGRVRVSVIDRGCGIPEEFRSRIFQKFAQADSSDARAKGGTGLGLSISKAIMEQLGGSISFESEAGRGTTFHVELREVKAPESITVGVQGPEPPVSSPRTLLP